MASRSMISSKVLGLDRSRRALSAVLRAEKAAVGPALAAVGQYAVTEIQKRAPLLTGRLRRSYTYEVDPNGRWVDVLSNVEYAPYQEFGTRFISGTPHVRPGIDATLRVVPQLVAARVGQAGGDAARRHGGRVSLGRTRSALADLAA